MRRPVLTSTRWRVIIVFCFKKALRILLLSTRRGIKELFNWLKCSNTITEMHLVVNNTVGWIYSTVRLAGILEVNAD